MTTREPPQDTRSQLITRVVRLRLEGAIADLFAHFESAGVQTLLLKGASFEHWLYGEGERRGYNDCDLLVAPEDFAAAQDVLRSLGYSPDFDDGAMPGWWRDHASVWLRDTDGLTVDLHRTLPGVKADAAIAWPLLSRDTGVIIIRGCQVSTLGPAARALHVALHAGHHGAGWVGPIQDLTRALELTDEDTWRSAVSLAGELDAIELFAAGLRLTAPGRDLAQRLALPAARSVEAALYASTPPPVALGFEQLAGASGLFARLEILWRKVVPPPEFIRHWDPAANNSRAALMRAYLKRPVWLLRNAPRGFRAWRQARNSVRSPRS